MGLLKYDKLPEDIIEKLRILYPEKQPGDFVYDNNGQCWLVDEIRLDKDTLDVSKPVWKHHPWSMSFKKVYTPKEYYERIGLSEKMVDFLERFNVKPNIHLEDGFLFWDDKFGYTIDSGEDYIIITPDFYNPDLSIVEYINRVVRK